MRVAFCTSEVFPFAKTGGLGDVCGSLPLALEKLGVDVSIFMPGYRCIAQNGQPLEQLNEDVSRAIVGSNIHVYFIDHDGYFDREGFYGEDNQDYPDNMERFGYFCNQVLKLFKELGIQPDIVHCHDWQTALIPALLKERYSDDDYYAKMKSILTIHNMAFQGVFPKESFAQLNVDEGLFGLKGFEWDNKVNLLKAGILYSDEVTTVSPQYAKEIQTPKFGCGLEKILNTRKGALLGILNGIDSDVWNPATDPHIAQPFTKANLAKAKAINKAQLQKELFLDVTDDIPIFGFVGRLSHQKGVDLILESTEKMIKMNTQIIFLGRGDTDYQNAIKVLADKHHGQIAACSDFNESLGHQIYAGSDFFLMPSRFEPCGLSQMISLRYATPPIVFQTGGLADSVKPYSVLNRGGTGLVFTKYTKAAFLSTLRKACTIFTQKQKMERLRDNTFSADFSWERSARRYQELYQNVHHNN